MKRTFNYILLALCGLLFYTADMHACPVEVSATPINFTMSAKASSPSRLKPAMMKTRRISTLNTVSKSFIFVDHQGGYIFTSLNNLSEDDSRSHNNKKYRYFKKGIPGKRVLLAPLTYFSTNFQNHLVSRESIMQNLQLRRIAKSSQMLSILSDFYTEADTILNI